jgi:hypothetical protein
MNVNESFKADAWVIPSVALLSLQVSLLRPVLCLGEHSGRLVMGYPLVLARAGFHSPLHGFHAGLPLVAVARPSGEMFLLLCLIERVLALLDLGVREMLLVPSEFGGGLPRPLVEQEVRSRLLEDGAP